MVRMIDDLVFHELEKAIFEAGGERLRDLFKAWFITHMKILEAGAAGGLPKSKMDTLTTLYKELNGWYNIRNKIKLPEALEKRKK